MEIKVIQLIIRAENYSDYYYFPAGTVYLKGWQEFPNVNNKSVVRYGIDIISLRGERIITAYCHDLKDVMAWLYKHGTYSEQKEVRAGLFHQLIIEK